METWTGQRFDYFSYVLFQEQCHTFRITFHVCLFIITTVSHTLSIFNRSTKKGNKSVAFRESFGNLGELRSFCKQGTPMGALTGTADQTTQETIRKLLCMRPDCSTMYVSPNRLT